MEQQNQDPQPNEEVDGDLMGEPDDEFADGEEEEVDEDDT